MPTFSPGEEVFHLPPDDVVAHSGPHRISRLIHRDPEGNSHYLVGLDLVLDEVELINADEYRRRMPRN